jgi:hypothetical protein
MLLAHNAALQMEIRELKKKIIAQDEKIHKLQSLLDIGGITKIFNELAPRSIYQRLFMGVYHAAILDELIIRYQSVGVDGPADRAIVVRIMNNIGREVVGGGLMTADRIFVRDGG